MLSIFLVAAIGFVVWSTFLSWKNGPWDLGAPSKIDASARALERATLATPRLATSTDVIVAKNLFDPERGASATRAAEETSRASQRIHNMVLVGTVNIGGNRTAIIQEGANPGPGVTAPAQPPGTLRLRVGDNVEGYRLSEIADKRIVFAKDAARIELVLDYFRKIEVAPPRGVPPRAVVPRGPVPPGPRVIPNLPRRGRIPVPGNLTPDS